MLSLIASIIVGFLGVSNTILWLLQYKWFKESIKSLIEPKPGTRTPDNTLIITPVRNDAVGLSILAETLLSQDYGSYTWVIVDDASTDNTPQVAREIASRDQRVRYVRVNDDEVPVNWSPKVYAIVRGLEEYDDGSYPVLVFLDSDVALKRRDTLRILVTQAYTYNAIASMNPRFKCSTLRCQLMETVLTTLAHSFYGFHRVGNPRSRIAWFYGCCWATTREAYSRLGGHKAYYNHIVEDKAIAEQAKKNRVEIRVINGFNHIETTWYPSIRETIEALQRILSPHTTRTPKAKLIVEAILLALHYAQPIITATASTINPLLAPIALADYIAQTTTHYNASKLNKHNPLTSLPTPITGQVIPIALLSTKQPRWKERTLTLHKT